jgi:hypothetical protein
VNHNTSLADGVSRKPLLPTELADVLSGVGSIKELLDERVQLRRFERVDLDDCGRMSFPGSPDLPSQSRHDASGDNVLSRVEGECWTFAAENGREFS